MLLTLIGGFLMALADSVPGVSGGTIAFLLGFYDEFIESLHNLVERDGKKRKRAFYFLVKLGCGWVIGFIMAVLILTALFETHIYEVSSLFLGFIIFSIPSIVREEKEVLKGHYKDFIYTLIGIIIVVAITYFNPIGGNGRVLDLSKLSMGMMVYVFFVAMIAISAMILPGISGSTLLFIFGLYLPIMNAIKQFLNFNFKVLPVLVIFGLGVLTGIAVIIKLVKLALKSYRSPTIYGILGLMLGSLYAISMGPTTINRSYEPITLHSLQLIFFVIGGVIVLGLQLFKNTKK